MRGDQRNDSEAPLIILQVKNFAGMCSFRSGIKVCHFFPAVRVAEQKRSSKATWNCGISREKISLMSCFKAATQTF